MVSMKDALWPEIQAGRIAWTDFEADDELYAKLLGDAPITVLVEADSDWSKKTEPLVFWQDYGKGRVFYNAYGHDGKALSTPEVKKIIDAVPGQVPAAPAAPEKK